MAKGGCVWQKGGMCGERGHAWQGGMCGMGTCMAGGVHGGGVPGGMHGGAGHAWQER